MAAIGADFTRAREARGFAVADVAVQLHIRPAFIEAIESEEWLAIGDAASLRGLLRTYARFLGLDAGAVVQRFDQECAPSLAAPPRRRAAIDVRGTAVVLVGTVALVVIVISLMQFVERARLYREPLHERKTSSAAGVALQR